MSRSPYVSVHVPSTRAGHRPSTKDVVAAFAQEIELGRLPGGARLPPVRVLERQLGLSKNTVQVAYDELAARGLIVTREREGAFVAERSASSPLTSPVIEPPAPQLRPPPPMFARATSEGKLLLSQVFIDPALLPRERFTDCMRSVLRQPGLEPFYDGQGYMPLRQAIAARLERGNAPPPVEFRIAAAVNSDLTLLASRSPLRRSRGEARG